MTSSPKLDASDVFRWMADLPRGRDTVPCAWVARRNSPARERARSIDISVGSDGDALATINVQDVAAYA
jgi:hypothetical protein